jgi:uncharacterized membrane protein
MELLNQAARQVDRLLGHGDAPARVSLPLAAWAAAVAGDGLGLATGSRGFDMGAGCAIGVGLVGSAGAMLTGFVERQSNGVPASEHPAGIAAHAVGALAVGGLFAASLALRVRSAARHERPSALARSLALAGGGLALANAILIQRLHEPEHAEGRARLDSSAPLGLHAGRF